MVLNNVAIDSMVAISSDGFDLEVNQGTLNGSLDVDSAIANLYDVAPLSQSTSSGEITIWSTHIFDVRLGGNPQSANLLLSVNDGLLWEGTEIKEVAFRYPYQQSMLTIQELKISTLSE